MKLKPDAIELDNKGTAYNPADTEALKDSLEITSGRISPPLVYRDPADGKKWKCLDGNHTLLILKKRGWGDQPIEVTEVFVPAKVKTEVEFLEWKYVAQWHVNDTRRDMDDAERKARMEQLRDECSWSQAQLARFLKMDPGDVSRLLAGKYEEHKKQTGQRQKAAREALEISKTQIPIPVPSSPKEALPTVRPAVSEEPGPPQTKNVRNLYLQAAFEAIAGGDEETATTLNYEQWHIRRQLKAAGVELFDEDNENPEA